MPKQIKLGDATAYNLAKRAEEDNLSLAGEVAKLLSVTELPPHPTDMGYLEKRFERIENKLDELKSLIEDTTIDRVEKKVGRVSGRIHLDWEITKEIFYEVMRDGGPEWFSEQTKFAIENLDTSLDCYIENDTLCSDDAYGTKRVILSISPRIKEFLKSKGIDI